MIKKLPLLVCLFFSYTLFAPEFDKTDPKLLDHISKRFQEKFAQGSKKLSAKELLICYQSKKLNPLCWVTTLFEGKEALYEKFALILGKTTCEEFEMLIQRQDDILKKAPDEIYPHEFLQQFVKRGGTKLKHWTLEEETAY